MVLHVLAPAKEAGVLAWEARYKVAVGVARALEYLHKDCAKPVVHRDVKTSNILLTADFDSQVFNFSCCRYGFGLLCVRVSGCEHQCLITT